MMRAVYLTLIAAFVALLSGCTTTFGERAKYGITFYCPGAGNLDMGDAGIRKGLEAAGYRGQIASVMWTLAFNPAIDQAVRINAKLGAERLARSIEEFSDKFPDRDVNLIGLSAGTGVAIWALEELKPGYRVKNVVLLASSLSHDYDVGKAAKCVEGKIYNYYSPKDVVLNTFMLPFGTIDGKLGEKAAGAVGLKSAGGRGRVVNIRWRPDFGDLGYTGGHTDGTSPAFVRHEIAKYIVTPVSAGLYETAASRRMVQVLLGDSRDLPPPAETPTTKSWDQPFPPPPTFSIPAPDAAASCVAAERRVARNGQT
jgi:pimeloyl-ACP methyl ester carboxylesterase